MLEKRVIYETPEIKDVVRRNIVYRSDNEVSLTMDIYHPANRLANSQLPVVIFVFGYPNSVIVERFGRKLKEFGQYVSWGQLAAASGIVAITYETTQPEKDIYTVLAYVREKAEALQIDSNRIGIWACSANVPTALSVLASASADLKCAVLYYGIMFDWSGSHEMEVLANRYGAAYPCKSESVDDLSRKIPLFVVRAGEGNPQLNQSIEYFVHASIKRNLPLTFINYAEGQHAFDIENITVSSCEIIKHTLAFLQEHLLTPK